MDKGFENMAMGLLGLESTHSKNSRAFAEGRDLWYEYQRINGYAFRPNEIGLAKLSRLLDLNINYIRKHINIFLEA